MWPFEKDHSDSPESVTAADDQNVTIENWEIVSLLEQVQSDPSLRGEIYRRLVAADLVLGMREPLPQAEGRWTELQEDTTITLLTSTSPDGGPALPVFTDVFALRARNAEAYSLGMAAADVIEMLFEDGYEGIVVNPAGDWIYIPREDLQAVAR